MRARTLIANDSAPYWHGSMFEAAEVGKKLSKEAYKQQLPVLREALLDAQFDLAESETAVVVVVAGAEGAGKGELVHGLLEWLDARGVETHAMRPPSDEERERPPFYRFWRRLPAKGKTGIFFGSWYTMPVVQRVAGEIDEDRFERDMHRIVEFERMLSHEGVLLIKLWLHITKQQQKHKLKKLESNPHTAWRVTKQDWSYTKTYDAFRTVASSVVRLTNSGHAPWHIVEAGDGRHRDIDAGTYVLDCLQRQLGATPAVSERDELLPVPAERNLISTLQLDQPLDRDSYRKELNHWQGKLNQLARSLGKNSLSALLVFEGSDGAGKGGCIRRVMQALDARFAQVVPIAAPSDEERAHPYLWRFWRTLPRRGDVRIYDRSWYGRVLVERIEGLCSRSAWLRAYSEINTFEQELYENGVEVVKFWLAISSDEQLRRFQLREETGYKRYKITDEDWRNREKAPAYEAAACDMIDQTSTHYAPWLLVEANNKLYARIKVLRTICDRLEARLARRS